LSDYFIDSSPIKLIEWFKLLPFMQSDVGLMHNEVAFSLVEIDVPSLNS